MLDLPINFEGRKRKLVTEKKDDKEECSSSNPERLAKVAPKLRETTSFLEPFEQHPLKASVVKIATLVPQ